MPEQEEAVDLGEDSFELNCIKCNKKESVPIPANLFGRNEFGRSVSDEIAARGWTLTKIIDKEGYVCSSCVF